MAVAIGLMVVAFGVVVGGALLFSVLGAQRLPEGDVLGLPAFSALSIVLYLGMLAIVWWIAVVRAGGSASDLGFRPFRLLSGVTLALSFNILGLLVVAVYVLLITQLGLDALLPGEQVPSFARQGAGATVFLVLAAILAPIAEETFFRGFILPAASNALGFGWGLVLTSALFGVAHAQPASIIPTFLLGLLLGLLYRITGSVWPPIIMHGANNALAVAVAVLGPPQ